MPGRATWTALTDDQLLAQCEVDTYRASGPGGQKRNKMLGRPYREPWKLVV